MSGELLADRVVQRIYGTLAGLSAGFCGNVEISVEEAEALHAAWNRRAEPSAQPASHMEGLYCIGELAGCQVFAQTGDGTSANIAQALLKSLQQPSAQGQAVEWTQADVETPGVYWCSSVHSRHIVHTAFLEKGYLPLYLWRSRNIAEVPPPPAAPQPAEPAAEGAE